MSPRGVSGRLQWVLLALVVAASSIFVAGAFVPAPHSGGDNAAYLSLAYSLLKYGSYTEVFDPAGLPHTRFPPVFPLLLATLMAAGARTWVAFKGVAVVATVASAALAYLWASRRLGAVWGAGTALLFAASSAVVYYSHWILADPAFVALTLLALWALDRADAETGSAAGGEGVLWLALGVAAAGVAYLTRSAGLPLILAVWGWLALRRRWRALGSSTLALGLPVLLWTLRDQRAEEGEYLAEFWLVNPYDPALGEVGVLGLPGRAWENLVGYTGTHIPAGIVGSSGAPVTLFGVVLVAAAAAGWFLQVRRRLGPAELFVPLYVGLILLWPPVWSGDRFALPLFPLLFVYAALALRAGAQRLGAAAPAPAGAVSFLAVLIPSLGAWTTAVGEASACSAAVRRGGPFACYGPGVTSFAEAAAWSGANLPDGAAVLSRKPRIFYVLSGSPSRTFPFTEDPAAHLELADRLGIQYVLVDEWDSLAQRYVVPAISAEPGAFCVMRGFGAGGTVLLGILPPEVRRREGAGAEESAQVVPCPPWYIGGDGQQVDAAPYPASLRVPFLESLDP